MSIASKKQSIEFVEFMVSIVSKKGLNNLDPIDTKNTIDPTDPFDTMDPTDTRNTMDALLLHDLLGRFLGLLQAGLELGRGRARLLGGAPAGLVVARPAVDPRLPRDRPRHLSVAALELKPRLHHSSRRTR